MTRSATRCSAKEREKATTKKKERHHFGSPVMPSVTSTSIKVERGRRKGEAGPITPLRERGKRKAHYRHLLPKKGKNVPPIYYIHSGKGKGGVRFPYVIPLPHIKGRRFSVLGERKGNGLEHLFSPESRKEGEKKK